MKKELFITGLGIIILIFVLKKFVMKKSSFDNLLMGLLIKYEGFRNKMYLDSVGLPTIGIGTLIDTPQEQYLKTKTITKEEAYQLAQKDLKPIITYVDSIHGLNENQKAALTSLAYNIGLSALNNSDLMKLIRKNPNDKTIELEFLRWNKATVNGKKVPVSGLTIRRQNESNLYFS